MKTLLKSLKITLAFCVFFSVFYILILWVFAQVAGPNKGNAEVATLDGKVVGAANVGQMFTKDIYFWGRPSSAGDGYDATSSAGSNKGPTNQEYLDEVKRQMPVLEAFNGFQPSYHLNEVAIRHWDGHWFGKRELFGDTFPHYWSTITGAVYYYYALCTGDSSYQKRAENVVRNNLCLFFEDGKASCAYMYPYKIDGVKAEFYDPYANDQDWALVYYLLVNKGL